MKPTVVSFATFENGYCEHLEVLVRSLSRFEVPFKVSMIPRAGDWYAMCNHKAAFISQHVSKYQPVIWLDADAEIVQTPALFDALADQCDVAYRTRNGEVCSGCVFFNGTDESLTVLEEWVDVCRDNPNELDQKNLGTAVEHVGVYLGVRVFDLPAEYCAIDDLDTVTSPVILQHQASRTLRAR